MKICFNLVPPINKLIAILVCLLLVLSYTKLKADNRPALRETVKTLINPAIEHAATIDVACIRK